MYFSSSVIIQRKSLLRKKRKHVTAAKDSTKRMFRKDGNHREIGGGEREREREREESPDGT
jgi:hypothetical protein